LIALTKPYSAFKKFWFGFPRQTQHLRLSTIWEFPNIRQAMIQRN
jgi:hypothetical protein